VVEADPKVAKPSAFAVSKGVGVWSRSNAFVLVCVSSWFPFLPCCKAILALGALAAGSCTQVPSGAANLAVFSKLCGAAALRKSEKLLAMVVCLCVNSKHQCKSGAIFLTSHRKGIFDNFANFYCMKM
jgi:hypothetical protein